MAMNLDKFEKYPLTYGPTPIEYLPRLTEAIGADVEIYAKRDAVSYTHLTLPTK